MLRQHEALLELLKLMEEDLVLRGVVNNQAFDSLAALLDEHKTFEEEFFYPKLDRELRAEQKKEMLERLGGFSV